MTRRKIDTIFERTKRQHTWETLKIELLKMFLVEDLTKNNISIIATKLEYYDFERNYCIQARRNLME